MPETVGACPNCAMSSAKFGLRAMVATAGLVAFTASSCSPVAVYGVPCTSKQLDGGMNGCPSSCDTLLPDGGDPHKDTTTGCVP